jgi:hypothetical protein
MTKEPLGITLREAADLLSLKDRRTVIKYGLEGRIRISGTGIGQRVDVRSIDEYLKGESAWHRARSTSDVSQEVDRSASRRAARSRGKPPSPLATDITGLTPFRYGRKPKRTLTR